MSHSILSPAFKEALIRQLVYLDENRYLLIDQFVSNKNWEQKEMKWLLQRYEKRVEKIVSGFVEDLLQSRILIGSKVSLLFEGESAQETYTIVLPDETDMDRNRISFLSPLGSGLLLAKSGDKVAIRSPEGDYFVTVLDNAYEMTTIPVPEKG